MGKHFSVVRFNPVLLVLAQSSSSVSEFGSGHGPCLGVDLGSDLSGVVLKFRRLGVCAGRGKEWHGGGFLPHLEPKTRRHIGIHLV